ncbi:MAG: SapC family protein [Pseudomonadota bacterium]
MSNYQLLDNVAHADLKVNVGFGAAFGDNINQALVFPTEFQELQREYPIFFRKSEEDKYYAIVLLGLDRDENLFLENDVWNARYIPAAQMRGPFSVALRMGDDGLRENAEPLIQIDLDNPRVSKNAGEPIFLPHGGQTPYLEHVTQQLRKIHIGASIVDEFFGELDSIGLIEPITVEAKFTETEQYTVPDIYTISASRMMSLTGEELYKLNQLGLLEHCFAILASADNVSRIVDMKALKKGQSG